LPLILSINAFKDWWTSCNKQKTNSTSSKSNKNKPLVIENLKNAGYRGFSGKTLKKYQEIRL